MAKYWIKSYHKRLDDPSWGRLPDNLWRRMSELELLAGELDKNGRLPSLADMSWRLRMNEQQLTQELDSLARTGLLEYVTTAPLDSYWFIPSFQKTQSASSDAERMQEYRKRKRKEAKEKENNNIELDQYIYIERSNNERNGVSNGVVTKRNGNVTHVTNTGDDVRNIITEIQSTPYLLSMIQELAKISKTSLQLEIGLNVEDYYDTAICLMGWDVEPEQVGKFLEWWQDPGTVEKYGRKGIYPGLPALKSVRDNFRNFIMSSKNGQEISVVGGVY